MVLLLWILLLQDQAEMSGIDLQLDHKGPYQRQGK